MDNSIILNEIDFWDKEFDGSKSINNKIYELAFFKIFVKFELFLTQLFINYSVGKTSSKGYSPERKLLFANEKHLEGILKNSKSSYIDYLDKVQTLSSHIFEDNKDPFSLVFTDPTFNTYYNQMKYIRNYIAHESSESKHKYHRHVIQLTNEFVEPSIYLSRINRKSSKSNYTIYIDCIKQISEVLLDANPYFNAVTTDDDLPYVAATKE